MPTPLSKPTSSVHPSPTVKPPTAVTPSTSPLSERVRLEVEVLLRAIPPSPSLVARQVTASSVVLLLLLLLAPFAHAQSSALDRLVQHAQLPSDGIGHAAVIAIDATRAGKHSTSAVVNTTVYEQDGSCSDGDCSIVDAVATVAAGGGGTVTFAASLNGSTITFNPTVGHIEITGAGAITIDASALSSGITFSGNDAMRHLVVETAADVTLDNVTLRDGYNSASGGSIINHGTLTLRNCTVTENVTDDFGGGIHVFNGVIRLIDTTISNNRAPLGGGGVSIAHITFPNIPGRPIVSGNIEITRSTISGNSSTDNEALGGGVFMALPNGTAAVTFEDSFIQSNAAVKEGGGLYLGNLTVGGQIINTTFSDNTAATGGGLRIISANASIQGSTIRANTARDSGGGLAIDGRTLSVSGTLVEDNEAYTGGGFSISAGTVSIAESTIADNEAISTSTIVFGVRGGGIDHFGGSLSVSASLIKGNRARGPMPEVVGGGLYTTSTTTITSTTFSDNSATVFGPDFNTMEAHGGGIYSGGGHTLTLTNSTITNSGAIEVRGFELILSGAAVHAEGSSLALRNSLIANALGGGTECALAGGATITTNAYMLIEDGTCNSVAGGSPTGFLSGDPMLGSLADNGGATQTHLPATNSPLLDAGNCSGETTDQRGLTRPYDNTTLTDASDGCDIGAVELGLADVLNIDCSGTCYVDANATGTGRGDSWTNAIPVLQNALVVAASGTQIWVANGTYYPDEGFGQTNNSRASTFQLRTGVALYGGFAGGETSLVQRDIAANPAILSGNIDQDGSISGNAYHVVTADGVSGTARLDGFTITGGYANGSGNDKNGGGITNTDGSPVIANSTITGNRASSIGGGMANSGSGAQPDIVGTLITNNRAQFGGGLGNQNSSAPRITSSTVVNNTSTSFGGGGGVYNFFSNPIVTGSTIASNVASRNGGGFYNNNSSPQIRSSIVWDNREGSTRNASTQIDNAASSAPSVQYSIVQGGLSSQTTDGGGNLTADPLLGALQANGGPTMTMLPAASSPVIDAGSCFGQSLDQRGELRPVDVPGAANADDGCDIGAIELQDGTELPVELTHFDATRDGEAVLLTWRTASETNNAGFEVQQASELADWQAITFVQGAGTTLETQTYAHRLEDLPSGTHRFRLKQVDFDGTFAYSPEVEVTIEVPRELVLDVAYPNPFNPETMIGFTVPRTGEAQVIVYDMLGREVAQLFNGIAEVGQRHAVRFNGARLASGTYLYRLTFGGEVRTGRMLLVK